MGGDSLALCRRAYDLYGQGSFDAMLELFAVDVEVYVAPPNFESGTYTGRDSLWRDGQVQRYEVYWDAGQGRAAFAERAVASP